VGVLRVTSSWSVATSSILDPYKIKCSDSMLELAGMERYERREGDVCEKAYLHISSSRSFIISDADSMGRGGRGAVAAILVR